MKCSDIAFGTYDCAYNIMVPWLCKYPWEPEVARQPKYIAVDKCLLPEIVGLWEKGIKTTGCCCGHGDLEKAFIGVAPEFIPQMRALGYTVLHNACRPGDEDSFRPMTPLAYGEIDNKGFNWWDTGGR